VSEAYIAAVNALFPLGKAHEAMFDYGFRRGVAVELDTGFRHGVVGSPEENAEDLARGLWSAFEARMLAPLRRVADGK
jgi:hypothetical protein